jgi:hypothetical protein
VATSLVACGTSNKKLWKLEATALAVVLLQVDYYCHKIRWGDGECHPAELSCIQAPPCRKPCMANSSQS